MAETYRGLTIRIGGDTTALTKALKYSNGAISQTQVELNKLAQAMKMDPSNVQTYNMHLNFMGQQASNAAMKLAQLKDAQDSVGKEPIKIYVDGSVKDATETFDEFVQKYREGTANIAADTQGVKRVLDSYTEQLAEVYTNLSNYVSNTSDLQSTKLTSAIELAMVPANKFQSTLTDIWDRFLEMPDGIDRSEESVENLANKVVTLSDSFKSAFDEKNYTIDTRKFEKAIEEFSESTGGAFSLTKDQAADMAQSVSTYVKSVGDGLKQVDASKIEEETDKARQNIVEYVGQLVSNIGLVSESFNNVNENVDLENIETVLEALRDDTGMTSEQVQNLLGEIEGLQAGFAKADTEYKNYLKAEQLIDLDVEIQKTRAQVEAMSRAMADLKVPDNISRTLIYIQDNVNALSTAFEQLIGTAGSMSDVIAKSGSVNVNVDFGDPTSDVDAFEVALRSLVESEQNVQEGMAAIRRELDEFAGKNVFIEDITDTTKSATQQLYDANAAVASTEARLAELNGTIEHYKDLLGALEAIGNVGLQSFVVSHEGDENLDVSATAAVERYNTALKKVGDHQEAVAQAIDDTRKSLDAVGGTLDATTGKYGNLAQAEDDVRTAQEELENAKMRVALEKLQEDLVKTQNQTSKVDEAIRKLAEGMTESMTATFGDNLFGNSNEQLDAVKASFDAAIERAKTLKTASAELPKNVELSEKKQQAMNEAIKVGNTYADELRSKMANIMPDGETEEVRQLKEEFGSAKNAVSELTQQADILNNRLVQTRTQRDMSPEGSDKWVELDGEVNRIEADLRDVSDRLHGISGDTVGAIAIEQWEEWSDELDVIESKLGQLDRGAIPGGSGGDDAAFEQVFSRLMQYAERVGGAVVESANTIDAAYRDMRKTVQGTEEQFEDLKQAAIEFSQVHAVSTDTLLEMEALGGQLGVSTRALQEFGEVASNLDIATDIDADTIALQLGQISNVMGDLDEGTFDNLGDALVRLGNNMAAQESSIMNVAQRMSSVANVANMTTPDLLALSAAIASTGQRSESAATAISNTMTGIASAVAAGGKSLQSFADIANMSASEFASTWMSDPTTALKAFIKGLESLSDTNTGAIAALEEMGISSVRQETALLGLASTVDVLDDALAMSNDAFNGVSDQWGQAGDAAIEAQRKSEGFSGSLQIMQNNAANLAETFGDSLVVPIQIASEAIKGLTDLLNFIPDPIKGIGVAIVGFTAVGGVALDTLDKMKKGFEGLKNVPTGSVIETVRTKLLELAPALESNAALASALSAGLALGGAAVATAALSALISMAVDAYNAMRELNEAEENLDEANRHLEDSIDGVTSKGDKMVDGLNIIRVTAEDATDALNGLADRVDEVADRISRRQLDMQVDFSQVDGAVSVLRDLADVTTLTYGQQADLINAVDVINEKMGVTFEVVDAAKGVIKDLGDGSVVTADQIMQWASSYKRIEEGEKVVEDMDDTYKALLETQNEHAEARKKLAELEEQQARAQATYTSYRREDADAMVAQTHEQIELGKNIANTNDSIENQRTIVNDLEKEEAELTRQYEEQRKKAHDLGVEQVKAADQARIAIGSFLKVALAERGSDVSVADDMAQQLISLGATATDMVDLTEYQLTELIRAYDGSVESIAKALSRLRLDFSGTMDEIGKKAEEAAEKTGKASQDEIRAKQEEFTKEYNDLKHTLDAEYDLVKKSNDKAYDSDKRYYDKKYDELKRSLDKEYNTHKQELDKDYDLMKKDFDRKYDLAKKSMDAEYRIEKDMRDKAYDERKKMLDNEYTQEKRLRDSAYNELKRQLDKEYDAEKDARDKAYNDLKNQLDKEYDAEKKALDKQYDQIKKSLDAEYNARKKSFDDAYKQRKNALDNEYKAAQKASKKYLDQFKKAQKAEVDAFKKATDERVAQMKRELDAKKQLIEADEKRKTDDIDARIKALKGETEAEEKAQKQREQQEKLSDLRKDVEKAKSRRTRAEAEKAYNDYVTELALEAAKEQREATIEQLEAEKDAIASSADERISTLEEQYDAELEAYKASRALEQEALQEHLDLMYEIEQENEAKKLEDLKTRHDVELEALKERQTAELEAVKESQALQLEEIKASNDAQLEAYKERNEAQLQDLKDSNEAELEAIKLHNEDRLNELKQLNDDELNAIKDRHSQELENLKDAHDLELQSIKDRQADELQAVKDGHQALLDEKKLEHDADLQQMKYDHDDKLTAKKLENDDKLRVAKEGYDAELEAMKLSNSLQLEELKAQQTHVINEMRSGKGQVDEVLDEGVQSVDTKTKSAASKFGTAIKPMETDAKATAGKAMEGLWNTINEKAGDVGFAVKNGPVKKAGDEASFLPDVFKKHATKGVENFVGPIRNAKDLENAAKAMRGKATKETDKTKGDFKKSADNATAEYGKSLKNSNEGKTGAAALERSASNALSPFVNNSGNTGKSGAESFGKAVSNYDVKSHTTSFLNKASTSVNPSKGSAAYQNLLTAGHNFVVGFVNGWYDDIDLEERARNLGRQALNAIKESLGINSPSREMIAVGRYTVQGFEVGIQQESSQLIHEMRLLAQSTKEGLSPTLDVDELQRSSERYIAEYKRILQDMLDMSRNSESGLEYVGSSLDAGKLKQSAQEYVDQCRRGVESVLEAAEAYAQSAEDFGTSFDVKEFREGCDKYLTVYNNTIRNVENIISDYNSFARLYGVSPLVSAFDIDSLRVETEGFIDEYNSAIRRVEELAAQHAEKTAAFESGFDTKSLSENAEAFADRYRESADELVYITEEGEDEIGTFDGGFDLNALRESTSSYLDEYRDVLSEIEDYAVQHSRQMSQYDMGGISGSVSIGEDVMASVIEGMRSMEGELDRQITRLVDAIEDGFNPTLDMNAMKADSELMIKSMREAIDAMVNDMKAGALEMVDVQKGLIADLDVNQEALARKLNVVVDVGFGSERLLDHVTEFLDETVAAAYEAIDRINSRMRNSAIEIAAMQAEAFGKSQYVELAQAQPATININVTLSDVTIRETADIDKLAQALAQRTNQIMRSRIG